MLSLNCLRATIASKQSIVLSCFRPVLDQLKVAKSDLQSLDELKVARPDLFRWAIERCDESKVLRARLWNGDSSIKLKCYL